MNMRKRFAGFLVCAVMLFGALFFAPVPVFDTFAKMLVGLYTLYLGGQTATDWKETAVKGPG